MEHLSVYLLECGSGLGPPPYWSGWELCQILTFWTCYGLFPFHSRTVRARRGLFPTHNKEKQETETKSGISTWVVRLSTSTSLCLVCAVSQYNLLGASSCTLVQNYISESCCATPHCLGSLRSMQTEMDHLTWLPGKTVDEAKNLKQLH